MQNKTHGGKRSGSGRKPSPSKRITMTIVVDPSTKEWLQQHDESAGRVIEKYLPTNKEIEKK